MLEPVPTVTPPHEAEYHLQIAPVPKEPPTTAKVADPPLQMVVPPETLLAAADNVSTVTVVCTHDVVLHVPAIRTK